ncbi:MAG: hypothetical protein II389_06650 [Acidaminococcaceae bacterium]|nr:hypothetical protein [Acidaminococcaceae bacterium]
MFFKSYLPKQYLAAAIVASLLQGVVTAAPVFAEPAAKTEATVTQEVTAAQDTTSAQEPTAAKDTASAKEPTVAKEPASAQEPMQSKSSAAADKRSSLADTDDQNTIDHSAESKPIQNEFLKEGEGIPGTEVPYQNERKLSSAEWKEIDQLEKDVRILQRKREDFFIKRAKEKAEKEKAFTNAFKGRQEYSIVFNPEDYSTKTMNANGEDVTFRAYEHLVYVKKPYVPESQMLSIYIPEAYLKGGTVNGFTAETAPIFMPNGVGGYMPGTIVEPQEDSRYGGANAALYALSNGYVVVSPAIRGRSLKHKNGYETGKAPALIVDYKAAVRFVRFNRKAGRIPAGDTEKIIASGTSAGGALSALLGATGNAKDYVPYLKEVGAAKERDDIFASMAYCPITNLENADMAYEWMFHNANEYYNASPARRMPPADSNAAPESNVQNRPANAPAEAIQGTAITPEQKEISAELKEKFSEYLNSLNLRDSIGNRLNLAPDGYGLFREFIESLYLEAAQNAIDTGEDISKTPWVTVSEGMAVHMDFDKYIAAVKRLKGVPAFDAFDMTTGENNEFGTYDIANKHFSRYALEHSQLVTVPKQEEEKKIAEEKARQYGLATPVEKRQLRKANLEEQMEKDKLDLSQYMANGLVVKMMNPMRYIGNPGVQTAPHWRIRHGALDRDTALAIPAMLAVKLKNSGKKVDFKVAWGYGHAGDYDLPDLFAWTDRICKIKDKADAILKEEQMKAKAKAEAKE